MNNLSSLQPSLCRGLAATIPFTKILRGLRRLYGKALYLAAGKGNGANVFGRDTHVLDAESARQDVPSARRSAC